MKTDYFGNELKLGDVILYTYGGVCTPMVVIGFTENTILAYTRGVQTKPNRPRYENVIKYDINLIKDCCRKDIESALEWFEKEKNNLSSEIKKETKIKSNKNIEI